MKKVNILCFEKQKKDQFISLSINNTMNQQLQEQLHPPEQEKERKYFALMEKVGTKHNYQIIVFIVMCLINMYEASFIFSLPYLLHQSPYQCSNLTSHKCKHYVCSLDPSQRTQFLPKETPFFSLADYLGDFRCNSAPLDMVQSITFLAQALSMAAFTFFTQSLGRKRSMMLSLLIGLVGVVIMVMSRSVSMLTVGVFIGFAGIENAYQYTFCYGSQVVAQQLRILFVNGMTAIYSIGIMINSFAFFGMKDWKLVFIWVYIIILLLIIVLMGFFVEKTPIDLLADEDPTTIQQTLTRIAHRNGITDPDLNQEDIIALQKEYHQESKDKFVTAIDICRYPSLRKIAIPILLANFISNYIYYGPSFITEGQDLFMGNIVSGISNLVGAAATQIFLKLLHRKTGNLINLVLMIILASFLTFPFIATNSVLKNVVYFMFRLSCSVYFNVIYLMNYESFPTMIRACAANTVYIAAGISGVIQPWSFKMAQNNGYSHYHIFGLLSIIGIVVNCFMKQTFNIPPPQIIQELHIEHLKQIEEQHEKVK